MRTTLIIAALAASLVSTAHAAPPSPPTATQYCGDRVCAQFTAPPAAARMPRGARTARGEAHQGRYGAIWDRISVPTPAGTWRAARSCGQRLAAFWGLGGGLDSTSTWPRRFERASAPGPRVAVYRPGHVMGVVGGSPGAWRVVSFNGDGHHGNVEFTTSRLGGLLLDTTRQRHASR